MMKLVLVGCDRLNSGGELFLKGQVIEVTPERAEKLLDLSDDYTGFSYFEEAASDAVVSAKTKIDDSDAPKAPKTDRAVVRRGRPPKAVVQPMNSDFDTGTDAIVSV